MTRIICKSITWFDIGSFAWEKGHQVTYIQWGVGELKWFSVSGDGNCLYLWLNYRILHLNFFFGNFPFATHLIIPISKHLCSSLLSSSRVSLLNVWSISVTILLLKKTRVYILRFISLSWPAIEQWPSYWIKGRNGISLICKPSDLSIIPSLYTLCNTMLWVIKSLFCLLHFSSFIW